MELFKTVLVFGAVLYVFWFLIKLGKAMLEDFSPRSCFYLSLFSHQKRKHSQPSCQQYARIRFHFFSLMLIALPWLGYSASFPPCVPKPRLTVLPLEPLLLTSAPQNP